MRKVELNMKENLKYEVIKKLVETNGNKERARIKLGLKSMGQVNRLIAGYKEEGKSFFVHGNRGRKPVHTISEELKTYIEELYSDKYSDCTYTSFKEYLEEAFLIEKSKRFDVKGKKYIETPSKYYFVDIGIRNSLINFRQIEKNHIMENIIYNEIRRRGFNVDVGIIEKRSNPNDEKRTYKQLEIDFVANKGSDKYYIQSAYSIEDSNKREQELQSLLNIGDSFKKIVIVYDHFVKWQDDNGIIYMSIYDFLLNDNSLKEA